jgi:hypothetical protein
VTAGRSSAGILASKPLLRFSLETSSTTSPFNTVELFHSGSSSVENTTYLGRVFSLSANWPPRDGHRVAKNS